MREDLLNDLEKEYEAQRVSNEHEETLRREKIRRDFPEIDRVVSEREALVFQTLRQILDGSANAERLPERMRNLNKSISVMLKEAGLPDNYLSPVYRCEKCRDTGYTGETIKKPCDCLVRSYQRKLRDKIGLGQDKTETFENYDESFIPDTPIEGINITQRSLTAIARKKCEEWADKFPEVAQRDILLTGSSGLGKTFLLRSMASRLIERGQNVLVMSSFAFLQIARKSYFESDNGIQELLEVPVLMLDDLGSEPLMQNITIEQLFNLINIRQTMKLSTVISTNLTLDELKDRYTERIASRLNNPDKCMILTLAGRDLRKIERHRK